MKVEVRPQSWGTRYLFHCPGCKGTHAVVVRADGSPSWTFDGTADSPTFSPSILVQSGHHIPGHAGPCWCSYNADHPDDPTRFVCSVCHSFVRAGLIEFLGDCTHELAGQTVDLPEIDPP